MSKVAERIQEIKTEYVGQTGKRVLLVEGPDDVKAFRIFLSNRPQAVNWESKWHLEPAGNKRQVFSILKWEPNWLGVVDRDDWTAEECHAAVQETPNLLLLPRFCLESYLVDPQEIWPALGPIQQAKVAGGFTTLDQAILASRQKWIRHAALWHTVNPLWRELREKGFPKGVLDPKHSMSDSKLLAELNVWHNMLDAQAVLSRVQTLEAQLATLSDRELLRTKIYAKKFYPMVVHTVLDRFLGSMSEGQRRLKLLQHMAKLGVPDDLDPVWTAMEL
jgi:hypothetical protein